VAVNRKLGRSTSHRLSLLNNLTTSLILNGRVETTLAKARELKPIADSVISLAILEKDNFEVKEKTISRAKLDKNGKIVKEAKTSKNGNKYEVVVRETVKENVNVDLPSRLTARKKMFTMVNKIKSSTGETIDLTKKLFEEIAPKFEVNKGGYTRIIKLVPRKGDGAEMAIVEII
jgi:large subunit ribosomal protein L17